MRRVLGASATNFVGLAAIALLVSGCSPSSTPTVESETEVTPDASAPTTSPTAPTTTTTTTAAPTTTTTTTAVVAQPPAPNPRYVVPEVEVEREAKQLASDIAYALTTYEEFDSPEQRLVDIVGLEGLPPLSEASGPLTHDGRWSRGEIVYPQMGGLRNDRVSVMVVTRQTVGSGSTAEFSVVRTLDVRLIKGESGWEFDALASAGGVFDSLDELLLAHDVAADPRIEMPDSARLDILAGGISPILLDLMTDIAEITPYRVVVLTTGHPYHVYETDRVSHHSVGRAVDIYAVGTQNVIDDREEGSPTRALLQWLWENPKVTQIGSPWDIDGGGRRSFSDIVHQDHLHVAVIGENDADWVPAIGDLVWEDRDADGIQDPGEVGIGGITVRLFDADGAEIDSTTTNDDGRYSFRNLWYGEYHVEVDIPGGFTASPRDQGADDTVDSDIDATGVMHTTTLGPREHDPSWDAGLIPVPAIGGRAWEDLNADGIQDPDENAISGITVRLFDAGGAEVGSTITDGAGRYSFVGLMPGDYHIEFAIPDGFAASPQDQGSDDTADSDIDTTGATRTTTLDADEHDRKWDAGLIPVS
ncbi:MAG: SdrD B-like domain-containing protein [Acidimicrobiia bacterium]|nr:SdrD B-like domain-containing protein [Acidimicrobiia bacterium]